MYILQAVCNVSQQTDEFVKDYIVSYEKVKWSHSSWSDDPLPDLLTAIHSCQCWCMSSWLWRFGGKRCSRLCWRKPHSHAPAFQLTWWYVHRIAHCKPHLCVLYTHLHMCVYMHLLYRTCTCYDTYECTMIEDTDECVSIVLAAIHVQSWYTMMCTCTCLLQLYHEGTVASLLETSLYYRVSTSMYMYMYSMVLCTLHPIVRMCVPWVH